MTLTLTTIALLVVLALLYALLPRRLYPVRGWLLFGGSVLALYGLQPALNIRWLDFWLPTLTLLLTLTTWALTRAPDQSITRPDVFAGGLALALVIALDMFRFVPDAYRLLVASRPPPPELLLALIGGGILLTGILLRLPRVRLIWLLALIGVFIILKTEPFAALVSAGLRQLTGQDVTLASGLDLNWLGFSYVAFRLIHTVRDRQTGILPALTLREYVTYVIFFPALTAGPIDRAERFVAELRALADTLPEVVLIAAPRWLDGLTRISIGIGKKFIIADTLAQGMSLTPQNALHIDNAAGMWLLLYGYGLRLFFDFAGYTDMVIGIGILFGVRLPENFDRPYTRTSITRFWQAWHITLSNWARFYVFSPLSRVLLRRRGWSPVLIVLLTQVATMTVIGLWHGVTLNFLIWGLWHGVGLWGHKQWSDRTRPLYRRVQADPRLRRIWQGAAWLLTVQYVMLGWVWFALPETGQALQVFARLFGVQ